MVFPWRRSVHTCVQAPTLSGAATRWENARGPQAMLTQGPRVTQGILGQATGDASWQGMARVSLRSLPCGTDHIHAGLTTSTGHVHWRSGADSRCSS